MGPERRFPQILSLGFYQAIYGLSVMGAAAAAPILTRYPGRVREGFHQYFGHLPRPDRRRDQQGGPWSRQDDQAQSDFPPDHRPLIWFHGVSLGESLAACALMDRVRHIRPDLQIGFTTTHPDVLETVRKKRLAQVCGYFPLDFLPFMQKAIARWRPRALILVETDFWPGLAFLCRRRNIPLILVNGRISPKLQAFYSRWFSLGSGVFGSMAGLAVQTPMDRERLLTMGALPERTSVLGNLKTDLVPTPVPKALHELTAWLGQDRLLIFGSLHPSEFARFKPLFARLLSLPRTRVLIAPRNTANAVPWLKELLETGLDAGLRSHLSRAPMGSHPQPAAPPPAQAPASHAHPGRILILDTYGELASVYALSCAAFIGGSLDERVGGHNPLEAINLGIPAIIGPHTRNIGDLVDELRRAEGLVVVDSAEDAVSRLTLFRQDQPLREQTAARAKTALGPHYGALRRTLDFISSFLPRDCR